MIKSLLSTLFLLGTTALGPAASTPSRAEALEIIRAVGPEGQGNAAATAAWKQLATGNASTIRPILTAMDGANDYALNWLRAAVDAIASRESQAGRPLALADLKKFLAEPGHHPRARWLALALIAQSDPTAADQMLDGMLNDPSMEIRRDAVQKLIGQADQMLSRSNAPGATVFLQQALHHARDAQQIEGIAKKLKDLGSPVDLQKHFGFIADWKIVGPFDNTGNKGFELAYPPEQSIDLQAEYAGKTNKVRWQDYT